MVVGSPHWKFSRDKLERKQWVQFLHEIPGGCEGKYGIWALGRISGWLWAYGLPYRKITILQLCQKKITTLSKKNYNLSYMRLFYYEMNLYNKSSFFFKFSHFKIQSNHFKTLVNPMQSNMFPLFQISWTFEK